MERKRQQVRGPQLNYTVITHPSLYIFLLEIFYWVLGRITIPHISLSTNNEMPSFGVLYLSVLEFSWGSVSAPELSRSHPSVLLGLRAPGHSLFKVARYSWIWNTAAWRCQCPNLDHPPQRGHFTVLSLTSTLCIKRLRRTLIHSID